MEDSQVLEPQLIESKRSTCFAKNPSTEATARFMHRQQMPSLQPPMRPSVLKGEHLFWNDALRKCSGYRCLCACFELLACELVTHKNLKRIIFK